MTSTIRKTQKITKPNYASRDQQGKAVFYVLLWKSKEIELAVFDDYWRDVHGPVCARLPGQHQYWQFHLADNPGTRWPKLEGLEDSTEEHCHGIAELTFATEADRQLWFEASAILMDDEPNLFSKAIGYSTSPGNSLTYLDRIAIGDPNGNVGCLKFHVLLKKIDTVSVEAFRHYLKDTFVAAIVESDLVLKLRLHLFEAVDHSRPQASGVIHFDPPEKQYDAALEIAFLNPLEMEKFFASEEYTQAIKNLSQYVKQMNSFPERTAYTFVYEGQMTLAGQRGSTAANLITNLGAANQLNADVVALMNGKQKTKISLGHFLQGVQHVGITVDDMAKATEFYTEVLGGKVALSGEGFNGEVLHNTLFQKEDIDAFLLGISPNTLGIPNLRDGLQEALDVKFISFGNICIELIHFRDAALTANAPNFIGRIPSGISHVNSPHISFHVKDDVDLNLFAKTLEEECQRRGITNVVCNRIIHVTSEAERQQVALKYNANKFWNDPQYFVEGYSDSDFGDFYGWSLFYCKGPNGEQIEFNQVTRRAKLLFSQAQREYNRANGTNFSWASDALASTVSRPPGQMSEIVKRMFKAGESMNVENFVKFYTDDALYQFSNFPIVYGPQGIRDSSVDFLNKVKAVDHQILAMWEQENTVICQMEVTYTRHDGKIFTLPCCDVIRFRGDLVESLQIYMDISPVFA